MLRCCEQDKYIISKSEQSKSNYSSSEIWATSRVGWFFPLFHYNLYFYNLPFGPISHIFPKFLFDMFLARLAQYSDLDCSKFFYNLPFGPISHIFPKLLFDMFLARLAQYSDLDCSKLSKKMPLRQNGLHFNRNCLKFIVGYSPSPFLSTF